ncbi:shikimate dehydrogenase [Candidatus Omnitrophota bacterium]
MERQSTYGLLGYPVNHSLSPLMHNAAFEALEIDAVYKLFSREERELEDFFSDLKKDTSPIFGLNVTVPYKEKVIPFLDTLSPFAQKTGAVNTITISADRKLTGQNTDGPGFLSHLDELSVKTEDARVAIIGAGGASRAIIASLCLIVERPASISLFDIDRDKARILVDDLSSRMDASMVQVVSSIDDLDIPACDIVMNATPIGMKKTDPALFEPELLNANQFVYDVIYNPAETTFLSFAKACGARYSNGLGMLYFQGVLAFQHWAETQIDERVKMAMREALEDGLDQSLKR